MKTESERFPGALDTYCIEALMQDGKALQAGTSHFLGQNFAKAFDVKFTNQEGKQELVWGTSWGVSTRLMGALVMAHSDDDGLVLPPKLAPIQVVIVPIYKGDEQKAAISEKADGIVKALREKGISVKYDNRDTHKPGWKFAEYELKGVPLRIAMGPRDLENGTVELARRDTKTKEVTDLAGIENKVEGLLERNTDQVFTKKLSILELRLTTKVDNYEEFKKVLDDKGGFIEAHWDGTAETEAKIKEETKATIRCISCGCERRSRGMCIYSGQPLQQKGDISQERIDILFFELMFQY